ncbi:hypothetical protein BV20DRAFT_443454 [Pilatotrama ljubarskyi]|nr:hypothetical protein BV20DRAFT_443454 [Pilatotrama ljubarskyi]
MHLRQGNGWRAAQYSYWLLGCAVRMADRLGKSCSPDYSGRTEHALRFAGIGREDTPSSPLVQGMKRLLTHFTMPSSCFVRGLALILMVPAMFSCFPLPAFSKLADSRCSVDLSLTLA